MRNNWVPKVSILIPVYNASPFLSATIESALQQTWKNTELIIVDDGSTDDSLGIAQKYASQKVLVIPQRNQGACTARNRAFRASTGDFIQYLDADDLLHPNKIKAQLAVLKDQKKNALLSAKWGRFDEEITDTTFVPNGLWQNLDSIYWLINAWTNDWMMQTACWLTPRHLIEKAGEWNESLQPNPADDGEFFARALLHSATVFFVENSLVYYRNQSNSLSQQVHPRAVNSLFQNCLLYKKYLLEKRKDEVAKYAIACNFAHFMYRFYSAFPVLIQQAKAEIYDLGYTKIPVVGGENFQILSKIIGFERALKLRTILKN